MELRRNRGQACYILFPIVDASGIGVAGVNPLRPQYATFTNVGSVSYAVPLNWASISGAGALQNLSQTSVASINAPAPLLWSSITSPSATVILSGTTFATVDGVTSSVAPDWGRVQNPGTNVNLQLTKIATVGVAVPVNWGSLSNVGFANNLTSTQIASVNYAVPLLWSSITSPAAVNDLSGTSIGTVSFATVGGVSTVTGVTNTVRANVVTWLTLVPNVLTGGRVDSYAAVLNWASVTAPTTTVDLTGTTFATVTGVTSSVAPDWGRVINPASTVNLTATTIASASNVATCQFVASVSNAVLTTVGTVTGVTNAVSVGTVTGVTNSVSVATVQGVTNRVDATLTTAIGQMLADRVLARSLASGADGGRTVQDAFRLLRNRRVLTTGVMETATLTAYQEDDTTAAWTAVVATASATGLSDINP